MRISRVLPGVSAATEIAAAGFVQPYSVALLDDVGNHLHDGQLVYSLTEGGTLLGFSIFNQFGAAGEVLYLSGIILLPAAQGQGLAAGVIEHARRETGATYLVLRTQSPRMWSVGNKLCQTWFPHPEFTPSVALLAQAHVVSGHIGAQFPVTRGHYGGPLYGAKPEHADAALQLWWDSLCDFARGDAVLCIGQM